MHHSGNHWYAQNHADAQGDRLRLFPVKSINLQERADKFECTRSNPNLQPKGFNISIVHFYFAFFASL